MEAIWTRKIQLYETEELDLESLNELLLGLYKLIEDSDDFIDHRVHEILSDVILSDRSLVVENYNILSQTCECLFALLRKDKKIVPDQGRDWVLRALKYVLVVPVDANQVDLVKKCYLMACPLNKMRAIQADIILEKLGEIITNCDEIKLPAVIRTLETFIGSWPESKEKTIPVIDRLISRLPSFDLLYDEFITSLLVKSDSLYYQGLSDRCKTSLCKHFPDILDFELIQLISRKSETADNWFLKLLAEDLAMYKYLLTSFKDQIKDEKIFEDLKRRIETIGTQYGFHSTQTYADIHKVIE